MMVRKVLSVVGALAAVLILSGCTTDSRVKFAKDAIKVKQWDSAVENLNKVFADASASKTTVKSAAKLFPEAAPQYYELHKQQAEAAQEAKSWDEALMHVAAIEETAQLAAQAAVSPPLSVPTPDLSAVKTVVVAEAAALHYRNGLQLEGAAASKEDYKQAAKEFRRTYEISPGYEDAEQRYSACRELAKMRVVVIPFTDAGGAGAGLGEMLPDALASAVGKVPNLQEFMELVPPDQMKIQAGQKGITLGRMDDIASVAQAAKQLGIDAVVSGRITRVYTNYPADQQNSIRRDAIVTAFGKNSDGSTYTYEKPVSATVYVFRRSGGADVEAGYQVLSASDGSILKTGDYHGKQYEEFQWARFSGDQEALTYEDTKLCKMPEGRPKPPEENIGIAMQQVLENFASEIGVLFNK